MAKNKGILFLNCRDMDRVLNLSKTVRCIQQSFLDYASGRARMPAKVYLDLPEYQGDFRAMPAYSQTAGYCALKWVNSHPENHRHRLPTVMGVLILSDPATGVPLSIMDGTFITSWRTAAAGAIAAKFLAKKRIGTVSLIGCGIQAKTQLPFLRKLFRIKEVRIWGTSGREMNRFFKECGNDQESWVICQNIKECVQPADLIVTSTPARRPLIRYSWISPGVHINAIGADAPGKQELDPAILNNSRLVIDDWQQATHSGEINVPLKKGLLTRRKIHATLGQILTGQKKGRQNDNEITIFDSTGLAIQDVALAAQLYQTALRKHVGTWLKLF